MSRIAILDPGHGGQDPGARGAIFLEKDINLIIARKVKDILEEWGWIVYMTRDEDIFVSLTSRTNFANTIVSKHSKSKTFCFVSIHFNAFHDKGVGGWEVYHYPGSIPGEKLAKQVAKYFKKQLPFPSRGVKAEKSFYVLRHTISPAILVEPLFLTNPFEEKWINNRGNQIILADSIAFAIDCWGN